MGAPQLGSSPALPFLVPALTSDPPTGTWQSRANIPFTSLIPLPSSAHLSLRQAGTLAINPPTAWRMLTDFVPLNPVEGAPKHDKKQWVIQNGANSAVGVAVIQLAKAWGVGTINLVRSRCVSLFSSSHFAPVLTGSCAQALDRQAQRVAARAWRRPRPDLRRVPLARQQHSGAHQGVGWQGRRAEPRSQLCRREGDGRDGKAAQGWRAARCVAFLPSPADSGQG